MQEYNPDEIEQKWQQYWKKNNTFSTDEDEEKEKFYSLIEFPYPSGSGLHVGHPRPFTGMDVISRKRRMEGENVLFPIGFDSFGLPTENYAIKVGRPPQEITDENIANFKRQLKLLGFSFDWSREVNTSDPEYYKWTQWIFLQLHKHGLAYKKNEPINWCPDCSIGLSNEEVIDGKCERCDGKVEKRDVEQWMLSITDYADDLIDGLENVDYIEQAKTQQKNWIGKSEGARINFPVAGLNYDLEVFTTRPDTIFGATYMVVAPEHELLDDLRNKIKNWDEVSGYVQEAKTKSDLERTDLQDKKTGKKLIGLEAVNPVSGESIPIFVADYVLNDTGTGAIMAVPAHDERDYEFAKKFDIDIKEVVKPVNANSEDTEGKVFSDEGVNINSDFLDGLDTEEAQEKIVDWLEENNLGQADVNYQLNDWVFSRQRYWGEPIPLVHCDNCKQEEQNVLIIHGFESDGDSNWFPWLEEQLKAEDFGEIYRPSISANESPDIETWLEELKPYIEELDENDVIIGHSLGARAALYLLEETEQEISHFYSVAGAIGKMSKRDWQDLEDKWPDSDIEALKDFESRAINWEKINDLVYSKNSILSEDDPFIDEEMYNLPEGWHFRVWSGHGHFLQKKNEDLFEEIKQAKNDGWVPLPEEELPLELPELEDYEPSDEPGESPLSKVQDWIQTGCPRCGSDARRETDVMPNWAGSSWYFLRYTDPKNDQEFASNEAMENWMSVDWYNGGMEHTTLHLLYSRFWNQFLYDAGYVPTKEPYQKRTSHGMILAEGGEKMSKSKGNVVNPDEVVEEYGADAVRTYIMFMGPFDQDAEWSEDGLKGVRRFLNRVWRLQEKISDEIAEEDEQIANKEVHRAVKKATEDIEEMGFNTAIAQMMECVNALNKLDGIYESHYEKLVKILSPFAPHMCEELNQKVLGNEPSVTFSEWPDYNEDYLQEDTIEIAVQINGNVRDEVEIPADAGEDQVREIVMNREQVKKYTEGEEIKKFIYVEGNLVSIAV
jgi:leucyl-tRNA synthetase